MKDYNLGEIAAGAEVTVNAPGNYIRVLQSDNDIKVKATSTIEKSAPAFDTTIKPNGARITEAIYTQWRVKNTSALAQNVTLLIGIGRAEENEIQLAGTVDVSAPGVFDDLTDKAILSATTTEIMAADINRKEAIITADPTNTASARIGGSSCGASRGTLLAPGATLVLNTQAAIYAYSSAAANFHLSFTADA